MSIKQRHVFTGAFALIVAAIIVYFLFRARNTNVGSAAQNAGVQIPPSQINLSFQTPNTNFTNQATGYVPMFGYIGYGANAGG